MTRSEASGLLMAIFCAIVWGASFPFSAVLAGKMDPVVFAIVRYGMATVGLSVFFLLQKKKYWLAVKDMPLMALAGVAGQAVFFYTSLLALEYISAAEVGVINGMIPIFTLLVGIPIYRKLPTGIQTFAVIVSFIGAFCIAFDPSNKFSGINVGHFYMVIGVLGFIVMCFANKSFADRYDGLSTMLYQFFFATIALLVVLAVQGLDMTEAVVIFDNGYYLFCALMLGLVCSGIAYVLYFYSLKLTGVERANMVQNLIPLSAFVLSIFMLDEQVTAQKVLGIVLVIGSLFLFDMKWETIKQRFGKEARI
ncbi:Permease of the drug/metabolite transporter (DMT) superfamily [Photobacterium marinum]|uniref:Permease of the drug/metabolite transporter (DMT) superfamily n=1 Tax=Photobacterium marinum TaxID=1056511 RepID=L8JCC1_9GAMM|nr:MULTISPECIES: DMT family transporter [Photobacterium]ELR66481.1 Permease of the drug/metabolite transporter (DMT) superfamily [Photobacterium marinum]